MSKDFVYCPKGGTYDSKTQLCYPGCPAGFKTVDLSEWSTQIETLAKCNNVELPDDWKNETWCSFVADKNADNIPVFDKTLFTEKFISPLLKQYCTPTASSIIAWGHTNPYTSSQPPPPPPPPPPPVNATKLLEIFGVSIIVAFIANRFL
jgi:hypothetical protein